MAISAQSSTPWCRELGFCNPGGSQVLYMLCIHHLGCFLAQHSSFSNALAVPSHNRHQYIVAIYHHTLCIIDIYRYVWWSRLTWYVCTYMYGAYTRNTHFETCGIRVYREPSFQYLVVGACICACAYAVRAWVCVRACARACVGMRVGVLLLMLN